MFPESVLKFCFLGNVPNEDLVLTAEAFSQMGLPVRVFFSGRLGANAARNLGLSQARGKWIYFLDDDCTLINPDHLANLLSTCASRPEVSLFGGAYSTPESSSFLDRAYNLVSMLWLGSQIEAGQKKTCFSRRKSRGEARGPWAPQV